MTANNASINQANAQHSTGPKTQAGKQRSSLNALRHGLTAQIVVMPTEDLQAYQRYVESFQAEYHPQGATEAQLVQALADTAWRLNRVAALETNLLSLGITHGRPIPDAPEQVQGALSIAAALESQSKALANLSMHSQRLSRQFERTLTQLRDLQKTRRDHETQQLDDLLDILQMHAAEGTTYEAREDGFVFSDLQIMQARQARTRDRLALKAYPYRYTAAA